jgi:hypothetical protein
MEERGEGGEGVEEGRSYRRRLLQLVGGGPSEHARFLSGGRGKRAGRRDSKPFQGRELGKIGPNRYTRGLGLRIEPSFRVPIPSASQTAEFAHLTPNSNSEPRFNATKAQIP